MNKENVEQVLEVVRLTPRHTFIFLTKEPWNLAQWNPFPSNCWVGVSATNKQELKAAEEGLASVRASVRFISFEPLLEHLKPDLSMVDWIIIGRLTGSKPFFPPENWIVQLTDMAAFKGIPVFEKDNLRKHRHSLPRREFPL